MSDNNAFFGVDNRVIASLIGEALDFLRQHPEAATCSMCEGSGMWEDLTCPRCEGTGKAGRFDVVIDEGDRP